LTFPLNLQTLSDHPLPPLPLDGDKEDRGAVLVVGGKTDMAGAAILAGVAALRVGAGKLQIRCEPSGLAALSVAVPEARILVSSSGASGARRLAPEAARCSALVIGPGMESRPREQRFARGLLSACDAPAVVDAGALPDPDSAEAFAKVARGRVILTPHAGEMAGMLGITKTEVRAEPLDAARKAAAMYSAVILMKGVTTFIVSPDGTAWRHEGGASGLGTSGSGDVLAGAIGGLIARGSAPVTAALWGVVLHARAGQALAEAGAPLGFLAREIPSCFPALLARLSDRAETSR